jgi:hypothetical protein
MSMALVLLVFVSSTDVSVPTTLALQGAAEELLGSDSHVQVRGFSEPPDDVTLSTAGQQVDAAAEVTWQDASHQRAVVRCYLSKSGRFVSRELTFDAQDDPRERGRMLGFAIASMLPEVSLPALDHKESEPIRQPAKPPSARNDEAASAHSARPFAALDAIGLAASGLGQAGGELGAAIAGRWLFHRSLALRAATGVRFGRVELAQADSSFFFGGLGLCVVLSNPAPDARFTFGVRTDALLSSYSLRRRTSDDAVPESHSRLQPAADLLFEGAWRFWNSAALIAATGGELGFGHTDVVIRGKEVTDIAPFRFTAELGVRATF